jgi:dephospho-CoA kinase
MLRVAVTGGIATGKSVVLARFAELGTPVLDADALVHEALRAGRPAAAAVQLRFGGGVIGPDGEVDRARLGALVFQDEEARRDLEAILHPAVYLAIEEWMRWQEARQERMAVAEIPLLFETGHEREFDCVVVTACDGEEQVRRSMKRSGLSEEDVRRRIAAQWPVEEKARRADFVIRTDGAVDETLRNTTSVWAELNRRANMGYL